MRKTFLTATLVFTTAVSCAGWAVGQAVPAGTGPFWNRPFSRMADIHGGFRYSLGVSELVVSGTGYGSSQTRGTDAYTNVSGAATYFTESKSHPFSMSYAGAYLAGTNDRQSSYVTQSLSLAQSFLLPSTTIRFSDSISYLPQAAAPWNTGFAALVDPAGSSPAGAGTVPPVQGILTNNATQISNVSAVDASRRIAGKWYLQGTGSYGLQRFTSSNGLDANQSTGTVGPNYRIDSRTSAGASYSYSHISYRNFTGDINVQGISATLTRNLSRRLFFDAAIGPQWTSLGFGSRTSTLNVAANTGLAYVGRSLSGSVRYARSTNSGFGVVLGSRSDSVSIQANRPFGRNWTGSTTASYTRSSSLPGTLATATFNSNTFVGGVQASRRLSRSFSAYASYSALRQSSDGYISSFAYDGLSHLMGFGITFSPDAWIRNRH